MELFPDVPSAPVEPKLSADRRRTLRRSELLAKGVHPATKLHLLDGEVSRFTCGDCRYAMRWGWRSKKFWKCQKVVNTNGPATDIRISWPACEAFEHPPT